MRLQLITPLIAALGAATATTTHAAVPATRRASGSLTFLPDEPLLTFRYSTPDPDAKNWVGVYHASGGGPENEVMDEPSLVWGYAPEAGEATVTIAPTGLQPGDYRAYFLAKDGYEWLADPVNVTVPFATGPVAFIVDNITLRNARQGEAYTARVDGLRINGGNSTASFTKVKSQGDDWVNVSPDGIISGTPDTRKAAKVTIEVSADGSSARLEADIPVRPADGPLVETLKIMTYNLWHGGTQVDDHHVKQVRFLASSGVDVVGVQESTGGHATRLGDALGWHSWQGSDVGLVSRYPIVEGHAHDGSYAAWVKIALGESEVVVWNVHLGYDPYGPYDFCFDNMTVDAVLGREGESGRTPQIKSVVAAMADQLARADEVPVLLVGDFNAPSHLDWIDGLGGEHCGRGAVPWPTSVEPVGAGMVDSFRVAHPDPKAVPGITWSPIFLENEGRPEPMDRIDFIYHKGMLEVVDSSDLVVGKPEPQPGHKANEWTSDHAAVLTTYKLK